MQRYLIVRLISFVVVLLVVTSLSFSLILFAPGDPAQIILGEEATPEDLARLREDFGFDKPISYQLILWFRRVLRGDLGNSIYYGEPATKLVVQRLEPSILLSVLGTAFATIVGIPLGIASARRRGEWLDKIVMAGSVLGMSIPHFG